MTRCGLGSNGQTGWIFSPSSASPQIFARPQSLGKYSTQAFFSHNCFVINLRSGMIIILSQFCHRLLCDKFMINFSIYHKIDTKFIGILSQNLSQFHHNFTQCYHHSITFFQRTLQVITFFSTHIMSDHIFSRHITSDHIFSTHTTIQPPIVSQKMPNAIVAEPRLEGGMAPWTGGKWDRKDTAFAPGTATKKLH